MLNRVEEPVLAASHVRVDQSDPSRVTNKRREMSAQLDISLHESDRSLPVLPTRGIQGSRQGHKGFVQQL
jgi:hypothetical protein